MSLDEEGHGALLRSLPPDELALHVEALLAALHQPSRLAGEGVLTLELRVDGADALGVTASHAEDSAERKRYRLLEAGGLRLTEARAVLEALWAANARLGGRPARTLVNNIFYGGLLADDPDAYEKDPAAFELSVCVRLLSLLENLFAGLPRLRAELRGHDASYKWCIELPNGVVVADYNRPSDGWADGHLFWATPEGGEVEAVCSAGTMDNAARDAFVAWSETTLRAHGWKLWQQWQSPLFFTAMQ